MPDLPPEEGDNWRARELRNEARQDARQDHRQDSRQDGRFDTAFTIRFEHFERDMREWSNQLKEIRAEISTNSDTGLRRGFALQRVEERLTEMLGELREIKSNYLRRDDAVIEDVKHIKANYVTRADHERDFGPIKKLGMLLATLAITAVVGGIWALLTNKGVPS